MSLEFGRKIVTPQELRELLGPRPRTRKAIMCHGTFDIVHPGHLRHLAYAKGKADILIASVTADEHIFKSNFRPYVPQELRAQNLAHLEMVDFVLVDPNPTPVENIRIVQPDYFAKGYEYFSQGIPPKTAEEIAVLNEYGGEMVFTPGDVVYSSSTLIDAQPPNLAIEKLLALMESEKIGFDDLRQTLASLAGRTVHVVGDTIVDSYSFCSLLGATAKSPTFSVRHERTEQYSGGAAVVAKHVRATGAIVKFTTMLGNDTLRDFVMKDFEDAGIACSPFIDETRPTTEKERFLSEGYKLLQVDRVDNRVISDRAISSLCESIRSAPVDLVIFSDFRHGIFHPQTIPALVDAVPAGALKVADSQVSNRWGNILDFNGFDLVTPNEREARFALADQDSVVRPLALELFRRAACRYLILKLGERGIIGYRSPGPGPREFFTVDSFVDHLVDPIGAGDALLAYAALGLVASGNIVLAALLGTFAAAVACEHNGNRPVSPDEVGEKIDHYERKAAYAV